MDDKVYINLLCGECDNQHPCEYGDNRCWWFDPENIGCTRQVTSSIRDEYFYRINEDFPLYLANPKVNEKQKVQKFNELLDWLDENVYAAPIGRILNGKNNFIECSDALEDQSTD